MQATIHPYLEPISEAAFLQTDGLEVCNAVVERESLRTHEDLLDVLRLGNGEKAILIPREAIHPSHLNSIRGEVYRHQNACQPEKYSRWNAAGGANAVNASPHTHEAYNCHIAWKHSPVATAFFLSSAVIEAVRNVLQTKNLCFDLRKHLRNMIDRYDRTKNEHIFFYSMHTLPIPIRGGELETLSCIRDIQRCVHDLGGMYEAKLDKGESGIVGIPANAVHGRSLLHDMTRPHLTGWRYFYKNQLIPEASDTPPASQARSV